MLPFINSTLNALKRNTKFVVIFSLSFILGVILGIAFGGNSGIDVITINISSYYLKIVGNEINIISVFGTTLFAGIGLYIAVFLLGLSQFTSPLCSIIIFYRGVIISSALRLLCSSFGVGGVIIFLILTLPSHLIITVGLIITASLNSNPTECKLKQRSTAVIKNSLISMIGVIISSIYICLILLLVIRPVNLLL